VTIETLPDDVLLEIFNFYLDGIYDDNGWHKLVHVCRNWRCIVFASPRRLNLRLLFSNKSHVGKMVQIWPPFPIVVSFRGRGRRRVGQKVANNFIAALKSNHKDRICEIDLLEVLFPSSRLEKVVEAMQEPFPALSRLSFGISDETALVLPDSFVGGSAPRLRSLHLKKVPFPALPKLLLTASDLVLLLLEDIPNSGYISPEVMVTCLPTLTRLEEFSLLFQYTRSLPDPQNRRLHPLPRAVLPALRRFYFHGFNEYLEDLVARIEAPRPNEVRITFFTRLIFEVSQLSRFLSFAESFKGLNHVALRVHLTGVEVTLTDTPLNGRPALRLLYLETSCKGSDWQVSSLAQIFSSFFPLPPNLERLSIQEGSRLDWHNSLESTQWLELLRPFTAVRHLYLSQPFAFCIAPALAGSSERVTAVLPMLQSLSLYEKGGRIKSVQDAIEQFITARQLSGHPVALRYLKG
jgi:hypothetical protein